MRRDEILKPRIFTDAHEERPVIVQPTMPAETATSEEADERIEFGRRAHTDKPLLGR